MYDPLDNPVWYALSQAHQPFSLEYGGIKFYHPDYCPFGGFAQRENMPDAIGKYARLADSFFVVGEKPDFSDPVSLKNDLVCHQMIVEKQLESEDQETIVPLESTQHEALFQLVNLVQPGYFRQKTPQLGHYFGIFKDGQLVAVTGERMRMNTFVEVSAVVTHPEHSGKGYAKQLVAHTVNQILNRNQIPFLHVTSSNHPAISLYEKLGFQTRRKISFWHLMPHSSS